ncbi:LPD29 domain-containing protein [Nocardia altamirensis]|uniref:LPD29 domain-containing protein n=1 Tax=Nocardia altamirensis TaxID=472158 RepID=UPI0008402BE4|nr:LPD29 domain-containing protein [Nocardia altamirensis]
MANYSFTETSAILRIALRQKWPAARFGARLGRGTSTWVTVHWTDGPSEDAVQAFSTHLLNNSAGTHLVSGTLHQRSYSPAAEALVIDALERALPEITVPRTAEGGLDTRTAHQLSHTGGIAINGRFFGAAGHTYNVPDLVQLIARTVDFDDPAAVLGAAR